jgi:DNA-binding transcriptional ArsR family regulator
MNKTEIAKLSAKCDELSQVLKSLAHPVRLKVLCQVIDGEKSVSELTEVCGISQSAMSQFLGRMRLEGVLESRRESTLVFYSLADQKMAKLARAMKEIYCK